MPYLMHTIFSMVHRIFKDCMSTYWLLRGIFPLLILMAQGLNATATWIDQDEKTLCSYVYAPGVLASEILMGRYCPCFIASTGEEVTCTKGIEVIRMPAT